MGVAVLGQLVVSVLAGGLVGRQGLRAGSVDSASHERLLEVALGVLQRASSPYPLLRPARPRLMSASCSVGGKPLAQHAAVLTPPPHPNPHPPHLTPLHYTSLFLSLSLPDSSPCPALLPPGWIIRFHIQAQQNHLRRNHHWLSLVLRFANAQGGLSPQLH